MQFHHHGYVSGDPRRLPVDGVGLDRPEELPDVLDVLVVGAGPAGMITAAQLSQFPNITTRLVERRSGRLEVGQADGIQSRTMETFQAFGFAASLEAEAYHVNEVGFWKPDPEDPTRIVRTARTVDTPEGLSEFPHLIVNQARVLDYFADAMRNAPTRMRPDYGYEFRSLEIDRDNEYPVTVTLANTAGDRIGDTRTVRAKYVVGSDGARSRVRDSIGCIPIGDKAFHAWGVMDVLAVTDFPDIRLKCAIQSGSGGSILLIPREGGYLVRFYVDLGEVAENDNGAIRTTSIEQIIDRANRIMHPYTLDVRNVAWYSVYEVGHRVTDRFDDVPIEAVGELTPRVFITGDACHTHSAKAGQGMNVSMQDGFNLGWKLGNVLEGISPESLLATYSAERQVIAQKLIDFDKQWSTLMAKKPEEVESASELEDFYVGTAEFPAGFMTQYEPSMITGDSTHQSLATGFTVGKRFKSAAVIRVADAHRVHLGHHHRADGRWRIYAFADSISVEAPDLLAWAHWLSSDPASPVLAHTREGEDIDAVFDVKAIYRRSYADIDVTTLPTVFLPRSGPLGLIDYEKVYAVDPRVNIFDERGIGRSGAVVVVRPDQYVAAVLPLDATDELATFFEPIMTARRTSTLHAGVR